MNTSVAIQMDAIEDIDVGSDNTLRLALEAERRGYPLFYYRPDQMELEGNRVVTRARALSLKPSGKTPYTLGTRQYLDLATVDVVLLRQDPPFDMRYITTTYFLDRLHPQTLVVNNPTEVRNAPEKLFACEFSQFTPSTLITEDKGAIDDFFTTHGQVIVKPLYGCGGTGVAHITDKKSLDAAYQQLLSEYNCPFVLQAFLEGILTEGDKRILLVEGEPVGAMLRKPKEGDIRANLHAGGSAHPTTLSERDKEICAVVGPELKKRGLLFVGIDVIAGYLTEINVTSPMGIHEINRFHDIKVEALVWDAIEARLREPRIAA